MRLVWVVGLFVCAGNASAFHAGGGVVQPNPKKADCIKNKVPAESSVDGEETKLGVFDAQFHWFKKESGHRCGEGVKKRSILSQ